ncbi:MAG: redoxin domain-containing protein, partial [Actinomycetota bacterium]|nr:redoxin domain-containing protein [Actinomycetota bacterium]
MKIVVGDNAPDFTLPDMNKHPVSLAGFACHKAVLLVFYPFAFSSICADELGALRENLSTFQNEKVQVLAVS